MTQEALKLALEALEVLIDSFADVSAYEDEEHAFTNELIFIPDIKKAIKAIAAAKEALAQPVQSVSWTGNGDSIASGWREINAPTGFFYQVNKRLEEEDDDTQVYKRPWVNLSDSQLEAIYYEVVAEHRGAPMPWGQVVFAKAVQAMLRELNT